MRLTRIGIIAGLCVSLAACSEFTSSGDPLTEAEANELAGELVGNGFPGTGGVGAAPPAAAPGAESSAPADNITITFNESGPCENGGTASIAGKLTADVNQTTRTGNLEYEFTLTPAECIVTTSTNKMFTLNGDPNVKADGKLEWTSTAFQGQFKYSGKFLWTANDGRSGACGVNLQANVNLSSSGTSGSASASVTGTVCGVTVNRQVAIES